MKDKKVILSDVSSKHKLREVLLIFITIFSIWIMVVLFSFNPSDPSWSQTACNEPIKNLGGTPGAWISDMLFFIFGLVSYIIPFIIISGFWLDYLHHINKNYVDYFSISVRLIGAITLILTSCIFFDIHANDIWYFDSGGIIGSLLSIGYKTFLDRDTNEEKIILLCIWIVGLTLFTNWSCLSIVETIGRKTMNILTIGLHIIFYSKNAITYKNKKKSRNHKVNYNMYTYSKFCYMHLLAYYKNAEKKLNNLLKRNRKINSVKIFNKCVNFTKYITLINPKPKSSNISYFDIKLINPVMQNSYLEFIVQYLEKRCYIIFSLKNSTIMIDTQSKCYFRTSSQILYWKIYKTHQHNLDLKKLKNSFYKSFNYKNTKDSNQYNSYSVFQVTENIPSLYPLYYFFQYKDLENKTSRKYEKFFFLHQFVPESLKLTSKIKILLPLDNNLSTHRFPIVSDEEQTFSEIRLEDMILNLRFSLRINNIPTRYFSISFFVTLPSISKKKAKEKSNRETNKNINVNQIWENNLTYQYILNVSKKKIKYRNELIYNRRNQSVSDYKSKRLKIIKTTIQYVTLRQCCYFDEKLLKRNIFSLSNFNFFSTKYFFNLKLNDSLFIPNSISDTKSIVHIFTNQKEQQTLIYSKNYLQKCQKSIFHKSQKSDSYSSVPYKQVINSITIPYYDLSKINLSLIKLHTNYSIPLHDNSNKCSKNKSNRLPLPSIDLLASPPIEVKQIDTTLELKRIAHLLEKHLADFHIKAEVVNYLPGPVVTRFELNLSPGVKVSRIANISRDLARSLSTTSVRVIEVIPGKPYIGLELPNKERKIVYLSEVFDNEKFRENSSPLTIVLGKDISGDPVIADLSQMPHLLVAGTTGSGKSVGIHSMILSMLYKAQPEEVRFIMIDPKILEFSIYEGIPHLLTNVITNMQDATNALQWSIKEMDRRYKLMASIGVRNIMSYNKVISKEENMEDFTFNLYSKWKTYNTTDTHQHLTLKKLPYIVVLIDEFSDLMMSVGKQVEKLIIKLAQKARAAGIHLILATQRPSVDVITGLIKANIPARIAFTMSSKIDSRTVIDQIGAESLLGMGDMLYSGPNSTVLVRIHGAFVSEQEVHDVVQYWKSQDHPQYIDHVILNE